MNKKGKSQKDKIRDHLLSGEGITSIDAFSDHWITRLSAIIHILKKKEKIPIVKFIVRKGKKRWALYMIQPDKLEEVRQAVYGK
jgi:hypothetical protein